VASNAWQGGSCGKGDAPPIGGFATAQRLASIALQRRSVAASPQSEARADRWETWNLDGGRESRRCTVDGGRGREDGHRRADP